MRLNYWVRNQISSVYANNIFGNIMYATLTFYNKYIPVYRLNHDSKFFTRKIYWLRNVKIQQMMIIYKKRFQNQIRTMMRLIFPNYEIEKLLTENNLYSRKYNFSMNNKVSLGRDDKALHLYCKKHKYNLFFLFYSFA